MLQCKTRPVSTSDYAAFFRLIQQCGAATLLNRLEEVWVVEDHFQDRHIDIDCQVTATKITRRYKRLFL